MKSFHLLLPVISFITVSMFKIEKTDYVNGQTVKTVETLGVGTTLSKFWKTISIMSDMWADALHVTYWDDKENKLSTRIVKVQGEVDSSAGFEPVIDATPQVFEKFEKFVTGVLFEDRCEAAKQDSFVISKGCTAEAIRGKRKVDEKGNPIKGLVVAEIEKLYKMGYRSTPRKMIGIATSDRTIQETTRSGKTFTRYIDVAWVWAFNCRRVDVQEIDKDAILARCQEIASGYVTRVKADPGAAQWFPK